MKYFNFLIHMQNILLYFNFVFFVVVVANNQKTSFPRSLGNFPKVTVQNSLIASASFLTAFSQIPNACQKSANPSCKCKICNMNEILLPRASASYISSSAEWYDPRNERIFDTTKKSYLPARPEIFLSNNLHGRNIVAIGEVHSNPCHHRVQFEVVKSLSKLKNPASIAIGLECFYRQHQRALDRFVFYHHSMAILKRETKWDETWGYDLNYYAKLFNFASVNGIRLVGLNVPIQLANMVNKMGLSNLPPELKSLLPSVDLTVERHKQIFAESIAQYGGHGDMNTDSFQRMYETQTLWDEYMSESAVNYLRNFPDSTLVLIAGRGHIKGRVAIPDRISKRLSGNAAEPFVIVPEEVDWSAENGLPVVVAPPETTECDWAWYTQKEIKA